MNVWVVALNWSQTELRFEVTTSTTVGIPVTMVTSSLVMDVMTPVRRNLATVVMVETTTKVMFVLRSVVTASTQASFLVMTTTYSTEMDETAPDM